MQTRKAVLPSEVSSSPDNKANKRIQLGDNSEGSMARLNPTRDTYTTALSTAARNFEIAGRYRRSEALPRGPGAE